MERERTGAVYGLGLESVSNMPELPEVETIARQLRPVITGAIIEAAVVHRRDVIHGTRRSLAALLAGSRIESVLRRAKRLIVELDRDRRLVFHLGMSGRITLETPDAPVEPHTHFRMRFHRIAQELRFRDPRRFGGIWYEDPHECGSSNDRRLGPLGIEPIEAKPRQFRALLGCSRRIKALLLDQTVIAGLGNIYCDESLHRAGIHPLTPASALTPDESGRLLRAIQSVLRSAIRHNGTTLMDYRMTNGAPGGFQRMHRVYHREGKPCNACGTTIERLVVVGRSSFCCPVCQKAPSNELERSPRAASGVER